MKPVFVWELNKPMTWSPSLNDDQIFGRCLHLYCSAGQKKGRRFSTWYKKIDIVFHLTLLLNWYLNFPSVNLSNQFKATHRNEVNRISSPLWDSCENEQISEFGLFSILWLTFLHTSICLSLHNTFVDHCNLLLAIGAINCTFSGEVNTKSPLRRRDTNSFLGFW